MTTIPEGVIQPQPVPMNWIVGVATSPAAQKYVAVQLFHALGSTVFFLDQDAAKALCEQIGSAAEQAKSGLVLPGSGFTLPAQNGHPS